MESVDKTSGARKRTTISGTFQVISIKKKNETISKLEEQIETLRTRESILSRRTLSLEKRNIKLVELNRIKDDFIDIASHQLRTPATGVKQYIKLLLDGYADELTANQRIFLERAHESNDRQLRIIDDLLRVARIDSETFRLKKSKVDVVKILQETVMDLKVKIEKHHQTLVFEEPAKPIMITGDSERLRMAFDNILDNAINYSLDNKHIFISVKNMKQAVEVSIKDEGVGIDKKDYSKLFQKFSRISNPLSIEVGGTGIGLYWASKVVQLHNGSIGVKSELDKGTAFTVVLPKNKK